MPEDSTDSSLVTNRVCQVEMCLMKYFILLLNGEIFTILWPKATHYINADKVKYSLWMKTFSAHVSWSLPLLLQAFCFENSFHQLQVFTSQFVLFPLHADSLFSHLLPSLAVPHPGAQEMPVSSWMSSAINQCHHLAGRSDLINASCHPLSLSPPDC